MRNILFIIDKIELKYFEFNNLVTNFWMIKDFLEKGCKVYISTISQLSLINKTALASCYEAFCEKDNIFYNSILLNKEINSFDLVMFRPDPPVDIDYINATYIFDFVSTKVINSPQAIRSFNEKLHSLYFSEYMTDCLVSSSLEQIESFLYEKKQIVLKPLNKCFGSGVMVLKLGDMNTRTIINTLTNNQSTVVMVQEFLPDIKYGDKRLIFICGEILEYTVQKLGTDDFKFNQHTDSNFKKAPVTQEEKVLENIIGKKLMDDGIYIAGLGTISAKIIEINVTSPCFFIKEINNFYNIELHKIIVDKLENFIIQKKNQNQLV